MGLVVGLIDDLRTRRPEVVVQTLEESEKRQIIGENNYLRIISNKKWSSVKLLVDISGI